MTVRLDFLKKLRWLLPGIKIKRWIALLLFGIFLLVWRSAEFLGDSLLVMKILDGLLVILGIAFVLIGTAKIIQSFISLLLPHHREKDLVDIMSKERLESPGLDTIHYLEVMSNGDCGEM